MKFIFNWFSRFLGKNVNFQVPPLGSVISFRAINVRRDKGEKGNSFSGLCSAPMVRFLRERLEKAGCAVGNNFFKAVTCDKEVAGEYVRREGVKVCSNYVRIQDDVNMVVIRELIHAFDDCRGANLNWSDCAHQACTEIRTNHLSGSCHYKRELLRGFLKIRGHGQECVKRKVMQALSQNPNCSGLAAKDAMEAVWDVCYNDTQPFDRAP